MKNIHVLKTDKPSRLFKLAGDLHLDKECEIDPKRNQNIYITDDSEIKKGDWCYHPLLKRGSVIQSKFNNPNSTMKKIILTTDVDLIKDGIQEIPDEFLEWFVKNPSCEWVEVEGTIPYNFDGLDSVSQDKFLEFFYKSELFDEIKYNDVFDWSENEGKDFLKLFPSYKIIIPKEEPKQETLEDKFQSWNELIKEVGSEEELLRILKLPHIAPLVREAMRSNCKK